MSSIPRPKPRPDQPAFVVGVSGHMDIPEADIPILEKRLRHVFQWLRENPTQADDYDRERQAWMPEISRHWVGGLGEKRSRPLPGLGLGEAQRIVLLTSLAPGADTIAAKVAQKLGIEVRCPLPFPPDLYRDASTFTGTGVPPNALTDFDRFVNNEADCCDHFEVVLEDERHKTKADRKANLEADRDSLDSSRRHLRYRAAGEYIAAHCHLLLALYTPNPEGEISAAAGTEAIVRVRHQGPTLGLLPAANGFPWIDSGPVFHLPTRSRKRLAAAGESEDDTSWQQQRSRLRPLNGKRAVIRRRRGTVRTKSPVLCPRRVTIRAKNACMMATNS